MTGTDRFNRLQLLIGRPGLERLGAASVAVFGLGGVGSFAVEALVRGGVGRLTLVDFDHVDLTNLNRQLHALEDTIGRPKAQRAVGSALAANVVGYLIPCHRVIRESGDTGHYRWGDTRKLAMLGREAAATTPIQAREEEAAPRSSQRSTTA